jgi:hypothetical protein
MYAIQTEQDRHQIRTKRPLPTTKMNSFRLHSNDASCSLKAAGKRAAASWKECVSLNMRDLLSEYVDPAAEKHMAMPPKQKKELGVKRTQYMVQAHALSKYRHYERSPGSPPRKSLPQHDRLQPITRKQSQSFDDLRKMEEQYPRYSLDTCDKKDIEDSLQAFQSRIAKVADTPNEASDSGAPYLQRSSSSFIREQEAIWSDFQPKRASGRIEEDANRFMIEENEASPRNSTPAPDVAPQPRPTARRHEGVQQEVGGSRITVFDQDHVYAAIENGTATVLKCVGCSKHLLATSDVKLVFCPGCGTLSPATLAKQVLPSGEQGNSGS